MLKVQYRTKLNKNMKNLFCLVLSSCPVSKFLFSEDSFMMLLTLDPWDCKSFPLKTLFHYIQVPFKTGFSAHLYMHACMHMHTHVFEKTSFVVQL